MDHGPVLLDRALVEQDLAERLHVSQADIRCLADVSGVIAAYVN